MVTGYCYSAMRSFFPGFDFVNRGMTGFEWREWLSENGYAIRPLFKHCNYLKRDREPWPAPPFAKAHICTVLHNGGHRHAVVMLDDGKVLDPLTETPSSLADYEQVDQICGVYNVRWNSHGKFDELIMPLRDEARRLGYAIGVHGTLNRDIDLIAVPWTAEAVSARQLAEALLALVEKINGDGVGHLSWSMKEPDGRQYTLEGRPGAKPHGRLGWVIKLTMGQGPYIDLVVMPRLAEKITGEAPVPQIS